MDLILNVTKESQHENLKELVHSRNSPLIENRSKSDKKFRYKIYTPLDYLNQALEICQESYSVLDSSIISSLQLSGASSILTAEIATNYMFQGFNFCLLFYY